MTAPSIAQAVTPSAPAPQARASAPAPVAVPMDATFIERNQVIERYLAGKLPLKGAQDFERFCREHPETVTALGMSDRISQALRLLESSGQPEPWATKPLPIYQQPVAIASLAAMAGTFLIASLMLMFSGSEKNTRIAVLEEEAKQQPLLPAQSTHTITMVPSRSGPPARAMATIGNGGAELADLKVDLSWSKYTTFRVTIDRVDQGRVAIIGQVQKDSNGHLRLALNSTAVGPGEYQVSAEGLDWKGNPVPEAWFSFAVVR
jgi:hypothetical protein